MKVNYYKVFVIAAVATIIFLLGRGCGVDSIKKTVGKDTTIYKDSIHYVHDLVPYKVDKPVYIPVPKPYKVEVPVLNEDVTHISPPVYISVDTSSIINEYFKFLYYSDTVRHKKGTVIINDTVTQNMIVARGVDLISIDTTIKETTILYPQKKNIVYFGLSAIGSPSDMLYGIGPDISLKVKSDAIFSLGAKFVNNKGLMYSAGVHIPIRLKK